MEVVQVYLRARAIWEVPTCSSGRRGRGVRANLAGGSGAYWISWAVEVPSCDFCCSLTTPISGPRRACGPTAGYINYIDMLAVGNGLCQPGGGRWALGFGDRKHRRTAVETRSAAALGQQVLCCRWSSARGSIKRAPANSQRPPACITTLTTTNHQQPLGRAKSADGPASAASHRSNMAFLSTRTSTPPGRGPVNMQVLLLLLAAGCCSSIPIDSH